MAVQTRAALPLAAIATAALVVGPVLSLCAPLDFCSDGGSPLDAAIDVLLAV